MGPHQYHEGLMDTLWPVITVLGPILLISTIIWVTLRNRAASRASFDRAERGAVEVREEIRHENNQVQSSRGGNS